MKRETIATARQGQEGQSKAKLRAFFYADDHCAAERRNRGSLPYYQDERHHDARQFVLLRPCGSIQSSTLHHSRS